MSDKLPDNGGYVAAAYLVFLALLLIYLGIMAYKLSRIQRDVAELAEIVERNDAAPAQADAVDERETTRA